MEENNFFGSVHFTTFVLLPNRVKDRAPIQKRVSLGKIDCYYKDRESVAAEFVLLNRPLKGNLLIEFKFSELVFN